MIRLRIFTPTVTLIQKSSNNRQSVDSLRYVMAIRQKKSENDT